jgi:hypothetical protein
MRVERTPPSSNLSARSPLWRLLINSGTIALLIGVGGQAIVPFTAGIARSQTPPHLTDADRITRGANSVYDAAVGQSRLRRS